ncbi:MAG: hypothetical protein ACTHJ0_09940 [Flavipsychrobacter sp.]
MQDNINTVVENLKHNESALIGSLRLSTNESGDIEVTGWSNYIEYKNITKEIAHKELLEVKQEFTSLCAEFPELNKFIGGKSIIFHLWFDDNGKGSVSVCSEIDGGIHWAAGVK